MNPTQSTHERWLPVPGYEGSYEVSDHGKVRSLDRKVHRTDGLTRIFYGKTMSPNVMPHGGHLSVCLSGGTRKNRKGAYIHRLVMAAFVGPCPEGMEVCHNNGNPTDNRLTNLRYGTAADNRSDSVKHGTHPNTAKTNCPQGHPLTVPNLKPGDLKAGDRSCLACSRARARVRRHPEMRDDLQRISDSYYAAIVNT